MADFTFRTLFFAHLRVENLTFLSKGLPPTHAGYLPLVSQPPSRRGTDAC